MAEKKAEGGKAEEDGRLEGGRVKKGAGMACQEGLVCTIF